jgi:hypothetical protein
VGTAASDIFGSHPCGEIFGPRGRVDDRPVLDKATSQKHTLGGVIGGRAGLLSRPEGVVGGSCRHYLLREHTLSAFGTHSLDRSSEGISDDEAKKCGPGT